MREQTDLMDKTMKLLALRVTLATVLAATGASALAQETPLESFSRADLIAALEANEATYEELADSRSINVTFATGIYANALLLECTDDALEFECVGTSLLATFNGEDRSEEQIAAAINTYNHRQNFGRAYVDPDGTVSVRLYIIADGGISRENYRRQIELWENSLNDFFGYLYGEIEAEEEKASKTA